jgi:hypothetical protein
MTIEQLWLEMEAEVAAGANVAWLTRFARPQEGYPMLVALEEATRARALLVPVSKAALPLRRNWPECRGLELISVALASQLHLGVRLRDSACADVFTALAEDVAARVGSANGPKQAAAELLGRLRRWQQFLAASQDELNLEEQRGLWGELHVLRSYLCPVLGAMVAVEAWKASAAAHQDFQFSGGAVEVKTTAAKQPQSIHITSERQLDATGVGALFLHVVVVDEREVSVGGNMPGLSLPAVIAEIRNQISLDSNALSAFNDKLLDRGWADSQASRYEPRRWTVRSEHTFEVRKDFPRLVESGLPAGVGDVHYAVSLAACEPFSTLLSTLLAAISETSRKKSENPQNT